MFGGGSDIPGGGTAGENPGGNGIPGGGIPGGGTLKSGACIPMGGIPGGGFDISLPRVPIWWTSFSCSSMGRREAAVDPNTAIVPIGCGVDITLGLYVDLGP